jgi:putative two-component system hydrogenase maturation factor HypX/HoxX
MRILFLTHSFNSLTQRLYVELTRDGHEVSIEFDVNDATSEEAVALHRPDVIVAPFLKRAIPESIWSRHRCLVVHPGPPGDRGPSSLDWAILDGASEWGVTVLQADAEFDAGPVWASATFPMRAAKKSSLYRNEVTDAAVRAVRAAVARLGDPGFAPRPLPADDPRIRARPPMRQSDRVIDWARDSTAAVLTKLRAADSFPGVLDSLLGRPFYLYGGHAEATLAGTRPGEVIARRDDAILRATTDGAVWITHLRRAEAGAFKLPAALALGELADAIPEADAGPLLAPPGDGWREITYEEGNGVGWLAFDFYNGAMGTSQCRRLQAAIEAASRRPVDVLVLAGGEDFWSNGIHLNLIEAAASPADASLENIEAIDDVARAILGNERQLTVAALRGNAGAGGVFLALAADRVLARGGVMLNPHYKGMGNLYGSEYWTYSLPRRVGWEGARAITQNRLPLDARAALEAGLADEVLDGDIARFAAETAAYARRLAADPVLPALLEAKRARRAEDERVKPLERYREEELERMRLNFYGFDPSYHVARSNFVRKVPHSWTPRHLALHRRLGFNPGGERAA